MGPEEPKGASIGGMFRGGRELYRRAFQPLIALALIQQALQLILLIPSLLIAAEVVRRMGTIFESMSSSAYRADPRAFQLEFQAQIQEAMRPTRDLALASQLAGGLGLVLGLIAWELLTSVALQVDDRRPAGDGQPSGARQFADDGQPSIGSAVRSIAGRAESFILPVILLAAGWTALGIPIALSQGSITTFGGDPRAAGLSIALGGLALLITLAAIYFAIRWSLAIPAMLEEGLGLRDGLARSSALTHGIRLRIALALLGVGILVAVLGFFLVLVVALVGLAAGSLVGMAVAGGLALFALAVAVVPLFPSMLVVAYRERVREERQ